MRRPVGLLAFVLAGSIALAQTQQAPSLDVAAFREKARKIVTDGAAPSVVVAVSRDGRLLWSEGFGFADRDARVSATAQTPYSVASLTKPFTATALMILAERRQVALDEPVERYLGPLNRPGVEVPAEVTLRRLLGHIGGFPVHYQYYFEDRPDRPLSFADTMRCYGAEFQAPGRYTYSNLGYGALGETISRVSGIAYRDFLAREIFEPLGLTRASVPERASEAEAAGAARRYGRDGGLLPFFVTDIAGGSALYASVEDLVRFGSFHAGALMPGQQALLTPASIAAMHQAGPGDYGLGWSVNRTWNRFPVVWHSGAFPGSAAALWTMPAQKVAVAVIANQITAPVNQLAGEILGALVPAGPPAAPAPALAPAKPIAAQARTAPTAYPAGRFRGTLMTCPEGQPITIEVRESGEINVTLAGAAAVPVQNASLDEGPLLHGTFSGRVGGNEAEYRFYLRPTGNGLAGPITRRVSLGPRANVTVTLWATLQRATTGDDPMIQNR
jgi:CubicO group peptidase (beta-lactamase class C family)